MKDQGDRGWDKGSKRVTRGKKGRARRSLAGKGGNNPKAYRKIQEEQVKPIGKGF